MEAIYLDHNATSLLDPAVLAGMHNDWARGFANPASQHAAGREARRAVEEARGQLLRLLGASPQDRLIFTSGGTESNYLAICGLAGDAGSNVVLSAIEHPSVSEAASYLRRRGIEPRILSADREGRWRLDLLAGLVDTKTTLVSLMHANNETGVIQPVAEAAELCNGRGVPLHTDAVQAVGKLRVDFRALGVSALSFTAHKFHGPRSAGGLLVRQEVALRPMWFPSVPQHGLRPGTEDVVLPRAMCRALERWHAEADSRTAALAARRVALEEQLTTELSEVVIHGASCDRLPQTICVSFLGVNRQALLMAADLQGLAFSAGSACASGSSEPSPTLRAMGLSEAEIESAVRLSFGIFNPPEQLARAAEILCRIVRKLRQK